MYIQIARFPAARHMWAQRQRTFHFTLADDQLMVELNLQIKISYQHLYIYIFIDQQVVFTVWGWGRKNPGTRHKSMDVFCWSFALCLFRWWPQHLFTIKCAAFFLWSFSWEKKTLSHISIYIFFFYIIRFIIKLYL